MKFMELNPTLEKILKQAKADGAEAEILIVGEEELSISVQKGDIDQFTSGLSLCAGVRVIRDGHTGYSSTENVTEEAILASYREALENATFLGKGATSGENSVMAELISDGASGSVETLGEKFGRHRTVAEKIDLVRRLEKTTFEFDTRVAVVPWNGYQETISAVRIFNSKGVDCSYEKGGILVTASVLARQDDESRTGTEYHFSRDELDVDPEAIGRAAAKKAVDQLGSRQPPTGVFPVLLDIEAAPALLGVISGYLSGKSISEKTSIFDRGTLGTLIASPRLNLIDDPFYANAPGSRPFDSEGTRSSQLSLIQDGRLQSLLLNSTYARKLGLANTGHAARGPKTELGIRPTNLVVRPGQETREALLKRYPRIVVVTNLHAFHAGFQAGSGNFSLQAEGELWENGERTVPLANFVVSGNFREFLQNIEAVGNRAPRPLRTVVTPEILVSRLSIAGQ